MPRVTNVPWLDSLRSKYAAAGAYSPATLTTGEIRQATKLIKLLAAAAGIPVTIWKSRAGIPPSVTVGDPRRDDYEILSLVKAIDKLDSEIAKRR